MSHCRILSPDKTEWHKKRIQEEDWCRVTGMAAGVVLPQPSDISRVIFWTPGPTCADRRKLASSTKV